MERSITSACVYHSRDLDGWASAAIIKKGVPGVKLIGWDYGQKIPKLHMYDNIIMVDVAFPPEKMLKIRKEQDEKERSFIWIDHHISAINSVEKVFESDGTRLPLGLRNTKKAACELSWRYYFPNKPMPSMIEWLGLYDSFRHKGTDKEKPTMWFQYAARARMFSPDSVLQYLNKWDERVEKIFLSSGRDIYNHEVTKAIAIYEKKVPRTIMGYKTALVNAERFNPMSFGIDYHRDGYEAFICYWFTGKNWTFSIYSEEIDCSEIAKKYGGGGHEGAAGFVIEAKEIVKWVG